MSAVSKWAGSSSFRKRRHSVVLPHPTSPIEHDEALALAHAELEVLERFLVSRAQVEEFRIRSDVERHLLESVVALIHGLP